MANSTLNGMTAATTLGASDLVYSEISPYGNGTDRKMTGANAAKSFSLLGAGALNNIASATPDLSAATTTNVTITGTTAITALGTVTAGVIMQLTFADALTLTHNGTTLILPGAANITTAAGDVATMQSLGSGNWRCLNYMKASGVAVSAPYLPLAGGTLTGALKQAAATIASDTTTDLNTVAGNSVSVTGTTQIDALGTVTAGAVYALTFADALQLTHNGTSLILPSGANITTAANDTFWFKSLGSGNWVCVGYVLASGEAIVGGGGGSADATVTGTDDAATDLAALDAAITAVAASATAPKTIAIVGTFAMGATRPAQLQYITLDLTRAYMKQTANFTDAAPWLRGAGMNITGGIFGTDLGAVAADNSILFGDTATAGDGPCGNVVGVRLDATWDALSAARTVISIAATATPIGSIMQVSSACVVTASNRLDLSLAAANNSAGNRRSYIFTGAYHDVALGGTDTSYEIDTITGTTSISGTRVDVRSQYMLGNVTAANSSPFSTNVTMRVNYMGGATNSLTFYGGGLVVGTVAGAMTFSGGSSSYLVAAAIGGAATLSGPGNAFTVGKIVGAATISATKAVCVVGEFQSTVTTAGGDGCNYQFGTVTGVLTASATDSVYIIGTLAAASQLLGGTGCHFTIGEITGTTASFQGTACIYSVAEILGAAATVAATCDSCKIDATMSAGSGTLTVTGGAFNNQINVISDVTPTFTTVAAQCENIVYWQRYSTTVNYPQQLVSYKGPNRAAMPITLAQVNALGAATSGQIAFTTLPASKRVNRAFVLNGGGAAATIATLTASIGPTGSATDIVTANTVFSANAASDTLGATLTQSYTAGTALVVELVADANLDTATGLASGLVAVCEWS